MYLLGYLITLLFTRYSIAYLLAYLSDYLIAYTFNQCGFIVPICVIVYSIIIAATDG